MEGNAMESFVERYKTRDYIFITCDEDGTVETSLYSKDEMEAVLNNPDFLAAKWRWNSDIDEVGVLPGHCYIIKGHQVYIDEKPQPKIWEIRDKDS